jgi:hypothetical protein
VDAYFYRTVYAPNGQAFEFPHERAAQLVLNKGWFNTPPNKKSAPKKQRTKKAAPASEPVSETVDAVEVFNEVAPVADLDKDE